MLSPSSWLKPGAAPPVTFSSVGARRRPARTFSPAGAPRRPARTFALAGPRRRPAPTFSSAGAPPLLPPHLLPPATSAPCFHPPPPLPLRLLLPEDQPRRRATWSRSCGRCRPGPVDVALHPDSCRCPTPRSLPGRPFTAATPGRSTTQRQAVRRCSSTTICNFNFHREVLEVHFPQSPRPSQPTPRVVQQHDTKPFYAATGEVKELPFGSSCWFVSAVQTHCHCEYIYGTLWST